MDDRSILELRQLCTSGGLAQDSLASLIDAELSVPALVKSEAAAMANAKRAGLALAERNKLREALRRHKDNVLSAVEPEIVEIGDDAEAHHIVAAQHHMMELRRKQRMQATEEAKGVEVVKNGNICAGYRWTQEMTELTVSIELPPGTAKRDVVCKISTMGFECGLRGQPSILEGTLYARVRVDECMWQLQDSHKLIVTLQKLIVGETEGRKWWPCLLKGEPEIDTSTCEEGEATNLLSTSGQRLRIQKIELPERKGDFKYDPVKAEKAWKDFFEKFPDMGAWEITFKGGMLCPHTCPHPLRSTPAEPNLRPNPRSRTRRPGRLCLPAACAPGPLSSLPCTEGTPPRNRVDTDSSKSMEEQLVDTIEKSLARDKAEWEKPTNASNALTTTDDAW